METRSQKEARLERAEEQAKRNQEALAATEERNAAAAAEVETLAAELAEGALDAPSAESKSGDGGADIAGQRIQRQKNNPWTRGEIGGKAKRRAAADAEAKAAEGPTENKAAAKSAAKKR